MMARKSSASHRRSGPKLKPAAARTALTPVADAAFEIVSVHAELGLNLADDGLDTRTTLHLESGGSCDTADLPPDPDPKTWMRPSTPVSFSMSATTGRACARRRDCRAA